MLSIRAPYLTAVLVLVGLHSAFAADESDVVINDFDQGAYGEWRVEGQAFGTSPATSEGVLGRNRLGGYQGTGAAYSGVGGDALQGSLTSPEFEVNRPYLNLLIGGSSQEDQTCVNLRVDGKVVRTVTGIDQDRFFWHTWDLRDLAGKRARVEILDQFPSGHIQVDQIALSNQPKIKLYPNSSIDQAMNYYSVMQKEMGEDSWRPSYHYSPHVGWMNDINGPFYQNGEYHIFYQSSPYHPGFAKIIGWAHARSKDLVHWERLPYAVWPERDKGERACWSGGMAFDAEKRPVLFYTSVPTHNQPPPFTQCAVIPTDEKLITWKKHPSNPLIRYREQGEPEFKTNWRDPCPFVADGRTFICMGGTEKGTPIYESLDGSLGKWAYRGSMFPEDAECPNFFQLDGRWIYLSSAYHAGVKYMVGTFDTKALKFDAQSRGVIDQNKGGHGVYGTNILFDDRGRCVFLARMQGGRHGWNGYMILPRVLRLDSEGLLLQQPVEEVKQLRGERIALADMPITNEAANLSDVKGDALEIQAKLEAGDAQSFGIHLRRSDDGKRAVTIRCEGNQLDVAGTKFTLEGPEAGKKLDLQIFLDRISLEVFVNGGRYTCTKTITPPEADQRVALFADGGAAKLVSLEAWSMKAAPVTPYVADPQ